MHREHAPTSSRCTVWERQMSTCTQTTAWGRTTMLQYLIWRVMTGLHHHITLSFLIVGNTKYSPNWCFGLLKQHFCHTSVGCLCDLGNMVNNSAEENPAQFVGTQMSEVAVPTYNWNAMFAGRLRKPKQIKWYHHFPSHCLHPALWRLG